MRCVALALVLLGACDLAREQPGEDAAPTGDAGLPRPDGDVVPPVGGPDTLDLAAWNIENFPDTPETPADVADLITSLDLDIVVVEEVASVAAWDELVARLPEHAAVLSTHRYTPDSYQKIGLLYREGLVSVVGEPELLFVTDSYDFPRPPFLVHLDVGGWTVDVVGVHLKAGTATEDVARRHDAVITLEAWLRTHAEDTIVMGDWNASLDPDRPDLTEVWPPITGAPDLYTIRTQAVTDADEASFIPSGRVIDHIVTTAGLADEIGARAAVIPPLDEQYPGYESEVSDHLPVTLSFPTPAAE